MKYVLIILIFPTTWQPGTEQHITFPDKLGCDTVRATIHPERDHMVYCVPEGQDSWTYENQRPKP